MNKQKFDITLSTYEGYRNIQTRSFSLNIKDMKALIGHYVIKYGQLFAIETHEKIKWYQFLHKGQQIDLIIEFPEAEEKPTFTSPKLTKLVEAKVCR